jgi:hypothetical protein
MGPTAMVVDEQEMAGIRSRAEGLRSGIIAGKVEPKHFKEFEQGRTEERARRIAFDSSLADADVPKMIADLTKRRRAMEGKEQFDIKSDTRLDVATGEMAPTEAGKTKAVKAARDEGEADRKERATLQASLDRDQRELGRLRADIVTRETPEGKAAIAELEDEVKDKKAKLGRVTPERMKESGAGEAANANLRAQAAAAIARGADRAAVAARFKQLSGKDY